jgi:cytochrome c oxidase subunit 2/cytochrome aa3-600 menaquinol oxidase subunit 2
MLLDRVGQLRVVLLGLILGHGRRLLKTVAAVSATPLMLAGCEGALSTVDPAGPAARQIATLWWVMLAGAALIFALVLALVAAAFFRRSKGTAEEEGHVRLWIVGLGLAFPFVVLGALLAYGLVIGEKLLPRGGGEIVSVQAEGRQWSWRFAYDDAPGRVTEDVLHIPAGRPVDVAITTTDVVHSFWVPRLAGKLDAIPGHVNVLRIQADAPGRYPGQSAEFSGQGYSGHTFVVVAHDAAEWDRFLAGEDR